MKHIAVVTVNYNSAADTHKFLESIEQVRVQGDVSLEVSVIDNGSKEPFTLKKRDWKFPVIVTRSEENLGFTGGNNVGMKQALRHKADYVLIINNDTTIDPQAITHLLTVLDSDKKIGVTVPKIYFAKGHEFHKDRYKPNELGKVFWYAGGSVDWANVQSVHRGVDEVDQGQYDTIEPTEFATGCCMLIKREVLEKVGLFDDRYFLYYEDGDLNERIKRAGYTVSYVPKAVIIHANASSSGGAGNTLHDYFLTRNQMLFGMTYAPIRTKIALVRQSFRLLLNGRPEQKRGIRDYYLGKFGKGTYFDK
jgi:GT2 family glycosyltransferase